MTTKQKQCLLHVLGYYIDDVDGKWGPCSRVAAESFQKDFGLVPTGHIDETGEKALKYAVSFGMPTRDK